MDSREFIAFSGKVVTFGPAGTRSAISRAYYGAFHFSRSILIELGIRVSGSGVSHAILINYLQAVSHSDCRTAGTLLSHLHTNRVKADYDLQDVEPESIELAQKCVVRAHELMRSLTQYRDACLANAAVRQDLIAAVARVDSVRQVRK
jgi:uncharacterized protein (UPF0332 family)